jgi:hypothetical protein
LLYLDGNVAGHPLKVVRPSAVQYELNLAPLSPIEEGGFQLTPPQGDGVPGDLFQEPSNVVPINKGDETHAETGDKREADPAHSPSVRGSDEGRPQGEAAGEVTINATEAPTGKVEKTI